MGIQWDVQAKMYDTFQGHQTRLEDPWLYTGPSSCTRSKTQGTSLACTSQRGPANGCSQRYFQHAMFDPRRVLYPIFWACVEAGIRRFNYWDILGCHIQTRMESPWGLNVVTHL